MSASEPKQPCIAFFVTCMVDQMYPEIGLAAVRLLESQGVRVVFPDEQTCCGQPAFNAGYREAALEAARHFIDTFWPLLDSGRVDAVVAPGGSCVAMVKHSYPALFEEAAAPAYATKSETVACQTFELTQYLVDVLGVTNTASSCVGSITYHPCCHLLRDLKVDAQPRALLAEISGAELIDLPNEDECCGFGGLFAVKNAEISTEIGRRKVRNIEASGADIVVVNDVSCMTHLNGILDREGKQKRVRHIVEVIGCQEDSNQDRHVGRK